jgi:hypothetical protein
LTAEEREKAAVKKDAEHPGSIPGTVDPDLEIDVKNIPF